MKDSYRLRRLRNRPGLRNQLLNLFDQASGWLAAALIGALTAIVAFLVDIAEATVSDWKTGYCKRNPFLDRETCCTEKSPLLSVDGGEDCSAFREWTEVYTSRFAIYVAFALAFGLISSSLTILTKSSLPTAQDSSSPINKDTAEGKTMYMAAGSGIPEIKSILSGFVIPNFLSLKVLAIKALGAVFAVATGMCLGKEGPFVHISTCVGWLVASMFPKYHDNGRKMREMLSAACAAGLSVAFGAPIGGVLFSYEEISTYFPRKVLWRAFLCSLTAAIVLKALNPTGTGKLVLFETHYGTSYTAIHYLVFVLLGVAGGVFGGLFCRLNFAWSRSFRSFPIIKNHPVFETGLVVLVTALIQFPNPLTRESGDKIIKSLLVDCRSSSSWVCEHESSMATDAERSVYIGYLAYGTLTKLVLTIVTFGIKVPSGVIIPALDAGALFGRLVGQAISSSSPGIFAMVGAAAFLAGVSRMTISLGVIMFELTGELDYVVPNMLAILVAKWVADAIGRESVYDLAQTVLGHPFMDSEHAMLEVQRQPARRAEVLIPPRQTMDEITVIVPPGNCVPQDDLREKLGQLRARGLMDAGLVLVTSDGLLLGYLSEVELEFGLDKLAHLHPTAAEVRLVVSSKATELDLTAQINEGPAEFNLSSFVDRTPLVVSAQAPLEYVVEMFGKLGLRYLILTEEVTGRVVGVVLKKRMVAYLDEIQRHDK